MNADQHRRALALIEQLIVSDPPADSRDGMVLVLLAELAEEYEKAQPSAFDTLPDDYEAPH